MKPGSRVGAAIAAIAACGAFAASAEADTFTVSNTNDSGAGSLRTAITNANADAAKDTIHITAHGTVSLQSALPALSQDVAIKGPGADKFTVLRGDTHRFRIFMIGNATVSISGLTATQGSVKGHSQALGGGISNKGTLKLTRVEVSDSSSSSADRAFGGGVYTTGKLVLIQSLIDGNTTRATTTSVDAFADGAGIFVDDGGSAKIVNSTITGNNNKGNQDGFGGSAIFSLNIGDEAASPPVRISASTVAGNSGYGLTGTANTVMDDTIVQGGDLGACFDPVTSQGYNLASDSSCFFGSDPTDQVGDANLNELADNGGPTKTLSLPQSSPAVDAGKTTLTKDQRGQPRPHDFGSITNATGGDGSDIGAFERQPTD